MLAVGDVSGKGAGAALLMANLQASLRTASGMGIPLNDIVSRINELICHNTPPEQYITFFAGMYHPKTKTFIYVNAGHNPPLVIRKNGKVETLYQGGLILGFEENRKYEQGSIKLQAGDVILMYTDGVSEAMNEKEEEFGENRIMEFIQQNLTLPTEEIVAGLEKSVEVFTGDRMFTDDFTLILVRVIR
jgi:sigma-B regulation protein RsbU (phosphoserine phosphatase)